jgi:hypothetical protein
MLTFCNTNISHLMLCNIDFIRHFVLYVHGNKEIKYIQIFSIIYVQPPATNNLISNWNGIPVEFLANATYSCSSSDYFFEMNRDLKFWNLTCLPGGTWAIPATWPSCVKSKSIILRFRSFLFEL